MMWLYRIATEIAIHTHWIQWDYTHLWYMVWLHILATEIAVTHALDTMGLHTPLIHGVTAHNCYRDCSNIHIGHTPLIHARDLQAWWYFRSLSRSICFRNSILGAWARAFAPKNSFKSLELRLEAWAWKYLRAWAWALQVLVLNYYETQLAF